MSLYKDVAESILKNHGPITTVGYSKKKATEGMGKIEIANNVLRSYFIEEKIKVIVTEENRERIQLVIDQLAGNDPGLDAVDCIVYAKQSVDVPQEMRSAHYRKSVGGDGVKQCTKSFVKQSREHQFLQVNKLENGAAACLKKR